MNNNFISKKESGFKNINSNDKKNIYDFCKSYIDFLNCVKTEREVATYIVDELEKNGFKNIEKVNKVTKGDKVYLLNKEKSVYAAVIGNSNMTDGINIIGSHIDSPRLDLKPNPLYEDASLALFKTHYYGGIKKYQWTSIPLEIHGVIVKTNGEKIKVVIGDDKDDITFTITDLLPHLAIKQQELKLKDAIEGEKLNILVGSVPNENNSVKENIMCLLNEKYNITENDFYSSELEVLPSFKAKSLGFDRSMIASYGQDDRICAYTSLRAFLEASEVDKTRVIIFSDKEEVGSIGNTGMSSQIFDYFISKLLKLNNEYNNEILNEVYKKSIMLSADVGAGLDPNYQEVSDVNNSSKIGYGIELNKYTGSRGKSGASDANAEFVAKIRNIFESNNIKYQVTELGKVDIGGGGTIAYILANKGIEVIDCGVPIISMHSPYEISSKFDVYEAYKGYKAFFEYNN